MYPNLSLMLLVLSVLISAVKMQKWTGTYAWNDQCKPKYCCCYTGTLSVVSSGSNLVFTSDTAGCGTPKSSSTFGNPDGYSFSAKGTRGAQITYRLSPDSNTLTVQNNAYSYCGGSAARTSTGEHIHSSTMSLVIILGGIWILL